MNSPWVPLWISFVAAAVLSWPIYKMLLAMRSRQTIDPHAPETHQRKQGTPTMGGIIILVGLMAGLGYETIRNPDSAPSMKTALFLALGFGLLGFIDDFVVPRMTGKRGLGWLPKLAMQGGLAYGAAYMTGGTLLAQGLMVFAILFGCNAFNFADGLDGLSGSIWLAMAPALALGVGGEAGWPITLAMTGGTIVFLMLNAPPAKVFMGDVGSLPIGAIIGWLLGRQSAETTYGWAPAAVFALLLAAELLPVPMQVAYYKLTKKRLFPMTPIHHGFEKKGWPETRVVAAFALFQLVISLAALTLKDSLP